MKFNVHHHAFLTNDILKSVSELGALGFELDGSIVHINEQKVSVCFLINFENIRYELVMPDRDNHSLINLIKKGISLYHIGYIVDSIKDSTKSLNKKGFIKINEFKSEAFNNNKCAFFMSRSNSLIELIEK